jgi:hypothetical protein
VAEWHSAADVDRFRRDSPMPKCYFVSTHSAAGAKQSGIRYATVEDALSGASEILGNGGVAVRIVDNEGNLILPHDQILLRLNMSSGKTPSSSTRPN